MSATSSDNIDLPQNKSAVNDLKEIRAAISSKPLTPSRESEKTSDSLASNLNIAQENSDVNELFSSLLLRGEITLLEKIKDIENRHQRYFAAVKSLEKLNASIHSETIKKSNSKFIEKECSSKFFKSLVNTQRIVSESQKVNNTYVKKSGLAPLDKPSFAETIPNKINIPSTNETIKPESNTVNKLYKKNKALIAEQTEDKTPLQENKMENQNIEPSKQERSKFDNELINEANLNKISSKPDMQIGKTSISSELLSFPVEPQLSIGSRAKHMLLQNDVERQAVIKKLNKIKTEKIEPSEDEWKKANKKMLDFINNSNLQFLDTSIDTKTSNQLQENKMENQNINSQALVVDKNQMARIKAAREIKENMPNLSENERAATVAILESGAKSQKMSISEYMEKTFPNGIFGDIKKAENAAKQQGVEINGAVSINGFGENAKAVIYAGKTADFSTWCHELSHVWQSQLTGELKQNAEEAFQVKNSDWQNSVYTFEDGHTDTSAEAFAYGFEDFLKHKAGEMAAEDKKKIFEKFADYMSRTYNGVKQHIKINEKITAVYQKLIELDDNILAQAEKAVREESENEFLQREIKIPRVESFQTRSPSNQNNSTDAKNVNISFQPVDDSSTLFQSAYHGSSANFDKFNTSEYGLSGDGAMAFGYGVYVSNSETIARSYAGIQGERNLYTVEIPDGDYIVWDRTVSKSQKEKVKNELYENLIKEDYKGVEKQISTELDNVFSEDFDGKNLYGTVSSYIGSDKETSRFFKNIGYSGIQYPAGTPENAVNYVIFDDNDIKIKNHFQFQIIGELGARELDRNAESNERSVALKADRQENKMENTSSENISYENEEMSKAAAIKERNQQKKLTTQMILDQEDKEQMENISATMKSATKDFMDLNATLITEERIDFLKTPTGNKSELSENEWKFSHSAEFKELYGDWEGKIKKDFLLNDDTVSKLTGDEFSRKEGFTFTEQVEQYFNETNNSVESPFFGKVVLDKEGADDSLSHGMGRLKAVAYAGVPSVIKNGVIIDSDLNHKDRGYNSYVIAAPIKIADKNYICEVVLKQNKQENRFYLHEVTEQKKFLERAFVTNPAQKPAHQGTLSNILEKTVSVNYEISCPMGINGEPEKTFVQNEYRKSLNEFQSKNQNAATKTTDSVKQEENPFKNADPDQIKELYEQAEAVEKMQQEAAENAVLDENGNTHYQTDEELLQEYKQKYPESSLSISEDTRIELENVFSQIDDYLDKGIVPQESRFTLPKVPPYLKELGSDETEISLPVSVIKKARETHGLSNEEIKNSLTRLYDPVAVFDTDKTKSENKLDSKLILTDEFSESKPIALALNTNTQIQVEEDGHRKLIEVQDIRSIHDRTLTAKNGTDLVKHWTENGLCRYVDDKKISEWSTVARVSFPIEALHSDKNNIIIKSEVVNSHNSDSVKQEENPSVQMEPRLMKKFDEMKKAIEDREKQEGQTAAEKTESAGSKKAESHEKPKVDLIKKAAKDFISAIKNGTAPFLNTTENDFGKILLHPAAIVNASNGLPFSGEAQLLAQIYHQQQKMETFFTTNSMEQIIVRPIFMEMNRWIVTASAPIVSPGTLKIVTADQNIEIPCDTESVSIEMFSNCYMLILKKNLPDEMCLKLLFLKKTVRSCTRRSEERFEVGTSNFKKFGFSSPVQHFLYNEQKIQCFVNNVSVHGAMITSRMSEIKTGERIKLLFSFENPPEKIVQFAIVVNRNCISGNYLRLSLYFLEPISFMWQKRICSL